MKKSIYQFIFILVFTCMVTSGCLPQDGSTQHHSPTVIVRNTTQETIQNTSTQNVGPTEPVAQPSTFTPITTSQPKQAAAAQSSSTPDTRLAPEKWEEWPIIPVVSENARSIYKKGLANGRNPHAFSRIGDCQNVSSKFLGPFENKSDYDLGSQYQYLQTTIDNFQGSFARESEAVQGGFSVASVLSPLMSDKKYCAANETPLDCEFRLNNPSIVIISMEQWWSKRPADVYEKYLTQIVDYAISKGAVPILATKADNLEGDNRINATIAKVAFQYDIPLWNFWSAVQPLPDHGLWKDGFHLTVGNNNFNDPLAMRYAWPVRNLTALQALDVVWHYVSK
jgi:hypothetical protein